MLERLFPVIFETIAIGPVTLPSSLPDDDIATKELATLSRRNLQYVRDLNANDVELYQVATAAFTRRAQACHIDVFA